VAVRVAVVRNKKNMRAASKIEKIPLKKSIIPKSRAQKNKRFYQLHVPNRSIPTRSLPSHDYTGSWHHFPRQ